MKMPIGLSYWHSRLTFNKDLTIVIFLYDITISLQAVEWWLAKRSMALQFMLVVLLLCGAGCQDRREEVWSTYDWIPPDAEFRPYGHPPRPYSHNPYHYPGYHGPTYDNDSTYIPPYDFGSCAGALGCE